MLCDILPALDWRGPSLLGEVEEQPVWAGFRPRTNSANKDNLDLGKGSIVPGELILPAAEFRGL